MDDIQMAKEVLRKIAVDLQVHQLALQGCLDDDDNKYEDESYNLKQVIYGLEDCIVTLLRASESINDGFHTS